LRVVTSELAAGVEEVGAVEGVLAGATLAESFATASCSTATSSQPARRIEPAEAAANCRNCRRSEDIIDKPFERHPNVRHDYDTTLQISDCHEPVMTSMRRLFSLAVDTERIDRRMHAATFHEQ
jgi:hypothetical protein